MAHENKEEITNKIRSILGLSFSRRYKCPNPSHPDSSESYALKTNHCFSCTTPVNSTAELIYNLAKANPEIRSLSQFTTMEKARSFISENGIQTFFKKKMSYDERQEEKIKLDDFIKKVISTSKVKSSYGTIKITGSRLSNFCKFFDIDLDSTPDPLQVNYQNIKDNATLSFGDPETIHGKGFIKGYSKMPEVINIHKETKSIVTQKFSKTSFSTIIRFYPSKELTQAIKSKKLKKINIEKASDFDVIFAEIIINKLDLPEIYIKEIDVTIPSTSKSELSKSFIATKKPLPDGVNYQNIDVPREYDSLLTMGAKTIEMTDGIDRQTQLMIKTKSLPITSLLTGASTKPPKDQKSQANRAVEEALEKLKFRKNKSENILKEIEILEGLSLDQKKSLGLQLLVAKKIKSLFPNEYYGVKGSANNLSILFDLGMLQKDPSGDPLRSPISFLDPATNKHPDIDFELSKAQIAVLSKNMEMLTRGLTVTKLGDRVHVCKYFLEAPKDLEGFLSGEYIPKESKELEASGYTAVDLISSRVMESMNTLKKQMNGVDVPDEYNVSIRDINTQELPHFNRGVLSQMKKGSWIDRNSNQDTKLDVEDMANICSLNRPIFYHSMVVLKGKNGDYSYSYTAKEGAQALYPLDQKSKDALEHISQADIESLNYATKSVSGLDVKFYRDNYLVSPPKWVTDNNDDILESTNGVIIYQDQLMLILEKYTDISSQEINTVMKRIAHPTKMDNEEDSVDEFLKFKQGTPSGIISQVKFITSSQNSFFFKKGHAIFVAETARQLSFYKSGIKNAADQSKKIPITNPYPTKKN